VRIGPYEIVNEVGRGAVGVVYGARSPGGGEVALKLLTRPDDPRALARFDRERRLLGSLGAEQGFVPLLDAGDSPRGPYIVMPLLRGGTLRARLRRGPLGLDETIDLARRLATALGRAHGLGIVHRDLKPENVLFGDDGAPLIADLGLAKHFHHDAPGASRSVAISRVGVLLGTAGYMSREQMTDARSVGPAADIFSLGAIVYECLTGEPPFFGENLASVLQKVSSGTFEPVKARRPDAPEWLASAVARALARAPGERSLESFTTGAALATEVGWKVPTAADSTIPPGDAASPWKRRALLLVGTLALMTGAGALGALHDPAAPAPEPPPPPPAATLPSEPPASTTRLVERAKEALEKSDWDRAIDLATKAIARNPKVAMAWCHRGTARLNRGELDLAIADSAKAIELAPGLAAAWCNRGGARVRKGDMDGGLADLTKALELDPGFAMAWSNRGAAHLGQGDNPGARSDCSRALELDARLGLAWCNRGAARLALGDLEGAFADETKAIEIDGTMAQAWSNRAGARLYRGDNAGTIADATKAIELDPKLALAYCNRGGARANTGDLDGGLSDLTKAIELDPKLGMAWSNRGAVKMRKGNRDAAIQDYTKAVEVTPQLALAWMNRGAVRGQKGDLDGEIADETRAVEAEPRMPLAWLYRAIARGKKGDAAGQIDDATHVIALDATVADAWAERAAGHDRKGDVKEAIADYEQFLTLAPDDDRAGEARDRVRALRAKR
jgi:tetratricopeptide (TPR) repeat protein